MKTAAKDAKYLVREESALDPIDVARTEGSWVIDVAGRRYLDLTMGWCVGNLGWGDAAVRARMRAYRGPDYVSPAFRWRGWADLAEALVALAPGRLRKCVRATGGTEAVEIALQAAMAQTGRRGFVSIEGSYHGNSIGAMSVGASEHRETYAGLLPGCRKLEPPLDRRAAGRLETLLKRRDVAAFVMEPVICNRGALVPDPEFVRRAQDLCRAHGTLFVLDEVATGFGRTGRLFAAEHFAAEPDALCLGKAIGGGYAPLGATLLTERAAKALAEAGFYSTFGWHPRSVDAALATLRWYARRRRSLERDVERMGDLFVSRLAAMDLGGRAVVRGKGLAIGVSFERTGAAERLARRALAEGVIVSAIDGETLALFPALTIDERTARLGLDRLERAAA